MGRILANNNTNVKTRFIVGNNIYNDFQIHRGKQFDYAAVYDPYEGH